jgi:hypothetical protein
MNRPWFQGRRATVAVALFAPIGLLATACTGGSPSASVARLNVTATNTSTPSDSSAASAQGTGALVFARCMRANGLPNWPDPESNGVFDKAKLRAAGYSVAQTRAVEEGPCKNTLPTGSPSPSPSRRITAQQQQYYLDAAACMRSHGIRNFPDPTFSNGSVTFVAPPGLETTSPEFAQDEDTCKKLIPAGLPDSGSDG